MFEELMLKVMLKVKGSVVRLAAATAALSVAGSAMAAAPDYTAITTAVDWSSVATGIVSVFALAAAVIVAFVGGKFLLRAIRGA